MQVDFPPTLEEKLEATAAERGCAPDVLVRELVARGLEEDAYLLNAVIAGEEQLDRGEHLTQEEVGERLKRFLRN